MVKVCKKCGALFTAMTDQYLFCKKCSGSICYRPKADHPYIHCASCGKLIKTARKGQRFCSDRCRASAHSVKKIETAKCAFCGEEFDRSTHKKKYCSHECYLKAKQVRDDARRNGGEIEVS